FDNFEACDDIKAMLDEVNNEVISLLFKGELPNEDNTNIQEARRQRPKESMRTEKEEISNMDERAAQNRAAGQQASQHPQVTETIVRNHPKIGRNDRVTIKNVMNGENKSLKYKQAIPLIEKGEWVLVEE